MSTRRGWLKREGGSQREEEETERETELRLEFIYYESQRSKVPAKPKDETKLLLDHIKMLTQSEQANLKSTY